jgi:hypothetical protein
LGESKVGVVETADKGIKAEILMTFIENGMDIYRRRDDKSDVTLRKI